MIVCFRDIVNNYVTHFAFTQFFYLRILLDLRQCPVCTCYVFLTVSSTLSISCFNLSSCLAVISCNAEFISSFSLFSRLVTIVSQSTSGCICLRNSLMCVSHVTTLPHTLWESFWVASAMYLTAFIYFRRHSISFSMASCFSYILVIILGSLVQQDCIYHISNANYPSVCMHQKCLS